ncbi:hypothetical protein GN958_ATG23172 [Phytophthora infestans]|uniref:Sfi1 spindle body domain-containing protein n=1 Tax=Phytophthora infestans TaxID=4787 RepID=A0A8S9THH0_PHYIN|nr:hypothetical protein GN958_ATG23172 [Phytophthora infestans]
MAHDQGEACIYVKQSVLRELEQERCRLKWQLSRALQTSDTCAAELEASKAKVKDLLTIVELNKGVAGLPVAVQRSHDRDVKRRAELDSLHYTNQQQCQRYVDLALRSMNRRVRFRQQRVVFQSLQQVVQLRTRRRGALLRLHTRIRLRILRQSLYGWKQVDGDCTIESAKVYPVQLSQPALLTVNDVPCSRSIRVQAKCDYEQIRRWQLLRKMWRNWERAVRWKRRQRDLLILPSQRLVRSVFVTWASRIGLLRQGRISLRRLLVRHNRRLLQLGLTRFRLRCAETSAHEWAEVLKTAHNATEEERKLRADVQSSAACELHTVYVREQQRQQQLSELQAQRREALAQRECKYRAWMILRCYVIQLRKKTAIAVQFQKLQHHQRVMRRFLTSWKNEARRSKRIKTLLSTRDERRNYSTKASCFKLLVWTLRRSRQQRFRLRALMFKLQRLWLMRGWLGLRIRSAVQECKAAAHVEMWQFSQQVEATQASYLGDIRRSRRSALKFQVTCALVMADKNQEKLLRRVLRSWSTHTATHARRRRALKRLMCRTRGQALRSALGKWVLLDQYASTRSSQLDQFRQTRRHRVVVLGFIMWKRFTHQKLLSKLATYRLRSCSRVWCHWHYLRQQRARCLGRFLKRTRGRWQRQAFQSWKIKNDQQVEVRANRYAAEHELVSRLWRRWIGYVAFRLQNQRRQQQKVLARARNSLQRTILSTVFVSWSTSWRRDQSQEKLIVRAFRRNVGQIRARRCLQAWLQYSKLMARRRAAVRRLYHRHCIRSLGIKWRHWIRASMSATITRLEAVTIRTQEQVHKVVRSTGRASILRRIIRKWRLVSVEATRQQRRRDLFTEKRQYMALQGTMRRWQTRITSCSLSKQRRTLRLLLNRLQLSLERQAFRLWERRARAHTLFERDRVSAELFRRSEVRVLVLTEKIQTERERRIVFSAWRSIAFRKKTIWKFLHSILLKYQQRLLQMSWSWWTSHTRTQRGVTHLNVMIAQRLKAAAWRKLTQMYHHHGLRVTGARLAGAIRHKTVLRHAWGHWKRIDNIVSSHAALEEAKASSTQSMLALKEVFARRHHKKRVLTELFAIWKQQTAHIKCFRHQLCVALGRLVEATPVYHFHKWRTIIERQSYLDLLLSRVVKRQRIRKMRSALGHWRRWAREMVHRQQLEQTEHALSHQREVSAKRIAVVK